MTNTGTKWFCREKGKSNILELCYATVWNYIIKEVKRNKDVTGKENSNYTARNGHLMSILINILAKSSQ